VPHICHLLADVGQLTFALAVAVALALTAAVFKYQPTSKSVILSEAKDPSKAHPGSADQSFL
jgi:hypothetical protein